MKIKDLAHSFREQYNTTASAIENTRRETQRDGMDWKVVPYPTNVAGAYLADMLQVSREHAEADSMPVFALEPYHIAEASNEDLRFYQSVKWRYHLPASVSALWAAHLHGQNSLTEEVCSQRLDTLHVRRELGRLQTRLGEAPTTGERAGMSIEQRTLAVENAISEVRGAMLGEDRVNALIDAPTREARFVSLEARIADFQASSGNLEIHQREALDRHGLTLDLFQIQLTDLQNLVERLLDTINRNQPEPPAAVGREEVHDD